MSGAKVAWLTRAAAAPRRTAPGARRCVHALPSRAGGAPYWVRRARSKKGNHGAGGWLDPKAAHGQPTHLGSQAAFQRLHLLHVLVLQVREGGRVLVATRPELVAKGGCGSVAFSQPQLHAPQLLAQRLQRQVVAHDVAVGQRGVPQRRALGLQRRRRRGRGVAAAHCGHRRPGRPRWRFAPPVQRGRHGPAEACGAAQLRGSRAHGVQGAVSLRRRRRPARACTHACRPCQTARSRARAAVGAQWVRRPRRLHSPSAFCSGPLAAARRAPCVRARQQARRTLYEVRERSIHERSGRAPRSSDSLALRTQHANAFPAGSTQRCAARVAVAQPTRPRSPGGARKRCAREGTARAVAATRTPVAMPTRTLLPSREFHVSVRQGDAQAQARRRCCLHSSRSRTRQAAARATPSRVADAGGTATTHLTGRRIDDDDGASQVAAGVAGMGGASSSSDSDGAAKGRARTRSRWTPSRCGRARAHPRCQP